MSDLTTKISGSAFQIDHKNNLNVDRNNSDLSPLSLNGASESSLHTESFLNDVPISAPKNSNPLLTSAAILPDFNGDGKTDKILYNSQTGETGIWLLDGNNVISEAYYQSLGSGWTFNIADFNADNKTDLILSNTQTGENTVLIMDGTTIASQASLPTLGSGWDLTILDLNGDNKTDVFARNSTTGENKALLMDGTTIISEAALQTVDSNWTPRAGFFNGDTKTDILWHNDATGENNVWYMDGTTATTGTLPTLGPEWQIASFGDFNFGAQTFETDIVWRNIQTGENKVWLIDEGNVVADAALPTLAGSGWQSSIADFDGNGKTDIFWYNEQTGESKVWIIDGQTVVSDTSLPTQSSAWKASISDTNGDGKTDIFLRNYETGENKVLLMDGTNYTEAALPSKPSEWIIP